MQRLSIPHLFFTIAFLLSLHLPAGKAQGQEKVLYGYLGVSGGESFRFRLVLSVYPDNQVSGYSYAISEKGKEIKAAISGTLDRENKVLHFREDRIVANEGFESRATICLIDAVLTYRTEDGQPVLSGKISSEDITRISCAEGSIRFTDKEAIEALFHTDKKPVQTTTMPPEPGRPAVRKPERKVVAVVSEVPEKKTGPVEKQEQKIITEGTEGLYLWNTDSVTISIRDGGREDGDRITLYYQDQPVLTDYTITNTFRTLRFPVPEKDTVIFILLAVQEGNEPPNTTDILLEDGPLRYTLTAHNRKGKKAKIRIVRKDAGISK